MLSIFKQKMQLHKPMFIEARNPTMHPMPWILHAKFKK